MTSALSWQNSYQLLSCFILHSKVKFACYSRYFLTLYFCIPVHYNERDIFFGCQRRTSFLDVSYRRFCRSSQNCSTSTSSPLLVGAQIWIIVILNGLPWICGFDCVDHNKLWKILKEMRIPDQLTCLLRNLYAGQEATVRTGHGTTDCFQTGKGVHQGCILSPCLFNLYAEYIM